MPWFCLDMYTVTMCGCNSQGSCFHLCVSTWKDVLEPIRCAVVRFRVPSYIYSVWLRCSGRVFSTWKDVLWS